MLDPYPFDAEHRQRGNKPKSRSRIAWQNVFDAEQRSYRSRGAYVGAWTLSTDYADRKPSRCLGTPLINGRLDESLRFANFNVSDSNIHYRDSWTRLKTEWDVNNDVSIHNVLYYLNSQRHWKDVETYSWNAKTGLVDRS